MARGHKKWMRVNVHDGVSDISGISQHERVKVHKKPKEQAQPPQGADQGDRRQVSDFCI